MDPVTQGALGAAAALSLQFKPQETKSKVAAVAVAGWIGGMAADLDVVIRSSSDPLLAVEFHRHFTHSLIFIPVGGLIVGLFLMALLFAKRRFSGSRDPAKFWDSTIFLAATVGYATHGLLDACTSYGTQLLWPFSNLRVAWNNVGIIDPIPTSLWIAAAIVAFRMNDTLRARRFIHICFALGLIYLLFGVVQRERASSLQLKLLTDRGIPIEKAERRVVKPTVLQVFLWRSIYEHEGRFVVDGLFLGLTSQRIYEGQSIEKLPRSTEVDSSRFERDLTRFDWFSDGWLAAMPNGESGLSRIGDMRYAFLPQEIRPLWGIEFDPNQPEKAVDFKNFRELREGDAACYFNMMIGSDCT